MSFFVFFWIESNQAVKLRTPFFCFSLIRVQPIAPQKKTLKPVIFFYSKTWTTATFFFLRSTEFSIYLSFFYTAIHLFTFFFRTRRNVFGNTTSSFSSFVKKKSEHTHTHSPTFKVKTSLRQKGAHFPTQLTYYFRC